MGRNRGYVGRAFVQMGATFYRRLAAGFLLSGVFILWTVSEAWFSLPVATALGAGLLGIGVGLADPMQAGFLRRLPARWHDFHAAAGLWLIALALPLIGLIRLVGAESESWPGWQSAALAAVTCQSLAARRRHLWSADFFWLLLLAAWGAASMTEPPSAWPPWIVFFALLFNCALAKLHWNKMHGPGRRKPVLQDDPMSWRWDEETPFGSMVSLNFLILLFYGLKPIWGEDLIFFVLVAIFAGVRSLVVLLGRRALLLDVLTRKKALAVVAMVSLMIVWGPSLVSKSWQFATQHVEWLQLDTAEVIPDLPTGSAPAEGSPTSKPPATEPSAAEPSATVPPATEPLAAEPSATVLPATEPSGAEPSSSGAPVSYRPNLGLLRWLPWLIWIVGLTAAVMATEEARGPKAMAWIRQRRLLSRLPISHVDREKRLLATLWIPARQSMPYLFAGFLTAVVVEALVAGPRDLTIHLVVFAAALFVLCLHSILVTALTAWGVAHGMQTILGLSAPIAILIVAIVKSSFGVLWVGGGWVLVISLLLLGLRFPLDRRLLRI